MLESKIFKKLIFKILRLIAKTQESVSEKHTAYYILLESTVIGLVLSLILVSIELSIATFLLPILSFLVLGFFAYIILLSRSQNNPAIIELNRYVIIILIFTSHLPIIFYYFIEYDMLKSSLTALAIFAYILNLQVRNKKYIKESEFFANRYSKTYGSWINASIKLEKAIRNIENENELLSYYWSLRAEWNYNRITYNETLGFKKIASKLSTASNLISAASLARKGYRVYRSEIYKTLSEAFELTNDKICDKCGNQLQVGSIHNYNNENLCDACKRMKSSSVGSRNKQTSSYKRPFWNSSDFKRRSNKDEEKEQSSTYNKEQYTDKNTHHRSRRTSRSRNKQDRKQNDNKELDKHFKILDISPDASMSELKTSYRKKVKQTHPDAGGSPEQFKKIKKAYNKVKPKIEKENLEQ